MYGCLPQRESRYATFMTNEKFQHQLKVLLVQIDKHLEAAEKAIQEGKTTQAEADINQSREQVRQIQDAASRITD
jgi:hypothetical protein